MSRRIVLLLAAFIAFTSVAATNSVAVAAPVAVQGIELGMGDSYAVGAMVTGNDQFGCKWTTNNYTAIVAGRLGLKPVLVACSGATVQDVFNGRYGQRSQLAAITPDVKLITVSAGGNDVQVIQKLIPCVLYSSCTDQSSQVKDVRALIQTKLYASISDLYSKIKQRATSTTRVLSIGYPIFMAASHSLGEIKQCADDASAGERTLLNTVIREMNGVLASAAAATGVQYIDPFASGSPFLSSDVNGQALDMCSNSSQRSITMGLPNPYHPTSAGVQDFADLISAA